MTSEKILSPGGRLNHRDHEGQAFCASPAQSHRPDADRDWIEQHMHPVEANRPAFADSTSTKDALLQPPKILPLP